MDLTDPKVQDAIKRHLRSMGKSVCAQPVPCFTEADEAVLCACMKRYQRWRAFWLLVRGDLEGFPRELPSWTPEVRFTGPIFIWICPGCGAREESWTSCYYGPGGPVLPAKLWVAGVVELTKEEQVYGYSVERFYACSSECANRYIKSRGPF